ncbi:ubiquinone/menaquinone biosynthesis protein [Scytonema hofmannii PCC 7110]|uniref:Ubiquinone/menaquinone biosynthesis protein n=1 Tax=Scytonema hofmannii PCC 7110 TaxID=128403 RepID=A0A139WWP0_9CYAN|nr:class I SAM-dependent methyltransferase [Scytonema hofmannii]KYC36857.1 ubiquinone/menaquinone biosynthesis protein [Scytonema hofmannii PCC 7110]
MNRIENFFPRITKKISILVLGSHPNNTIFSFNYHNVYHINKFLLQCKEKINSPGHILVDIGSGRSPYYLIFSDIVSKYIAVDSSESLPKNESRAIEQIPGIAETVPLTDAIADIVLCNQVLEHVNDPSKAANEMYRILKPGGKCIGSVPHVSPVHLEPYDFRRYTDLGVKQLLQNAGFVEITVEGNGGVHSTAALMIAMDWMLTPRREGEPQRFSSTKALLLSPLVGLMNTIGLILDSWLGNKQRTPANLCWTAIKPFHE